MKPALIALDAVGTLIRPTESISLVYQRYGQQFGCPLSKQTIKARFQAGRQKLFGHSQSFPSSEMIEWQRWRQLVRSVFEEMDSPEIDDLFNQLWNHYAQPTSWQLFPESTDCLNRLWQAGHQVVIASNFDKRLLKICETLQPLDQIQHVFYSTRLGFCKPDQRFFQAIKQTLPDFPRYVMAGDDPINDVDAAKLAGFVAFHVARPTVDLNEFANRLPQLLDSVDDC